MKRLFIIILVILIADAGSLYSQDLLKKVGKAVTKEVLGNGSSQNNAKSDPEPACACDNPELVVDLSGSLKIDYKESTISTMDDGSLLIQDRLSGKYYIVRGGVTQGPISEGDPRIAGFEDPDEDMTKEQLLVRYKNYLSRSGDKYMINFGGKSYGPYGEIHNFAISRSKDKFAALVVENVVVTEMDGKAMDEAIKNAKTDQERMQLAMKYSQQMQQRVMQGGGPSSMTLKLVSNIPNTAYDPVNQPGAVPRGDMKYDDILLPSLNKIYNLQGQEVITIKNQHAGAKKIFVNSSNTIYAFYDYGTLTFSDGSSLPDLFNPHLVKTGGQVYLAYMYYSPKRNALMQCRIPF